MMDAEQVQELANLITRTDRRGNLMPSYLKTPISDKAKALGLVEDCVDEDTNFQWERLTQQGKDLKIKMGHL